MRTLTAGTRLVVASHNPGKIREFRALLAPFRIEVISAGELGLPEPEETGDTFAENARIKALAAAIAAQLPALSDDSGLEVAALDGAPGVVSARWAGPGKDFGAAMARVERELQGKGAGIASSTNSSPGVVAAVGGAVARKEVGGAVARKEVGGAVAKKESTGAVANQRRANFTAALCLAWPDGAAEVFEGKVFGTLVWPPRGNRGFGYDPMFLADGEKETFGEMDPDRKHAISHRARAFKLFVERAIR